MEAQFTEKTNGGQSGFNISRVVFKSFLRTPVHGILYMPHKMKNIKPIIVIHDYNNPFYYQNIPLKENFAYFFLILRGHQTIMDEKNSAEPEEIEQKKKPKKKKNNKKEEKPISELPGFILENIHDADSYYIKGIYLDVLRSIDLLRLNKDLDCREISIISKGLGGAAAIFAAAFSDRICSIYLDSPALSYLPLAQNISESDFTDEINHFLDKNKNHKDRIKENLTYFDAINFADRVKSKILLNIGLKNRVSPPSCSFALFNHLKCDKQVEVYPNDGNDAGGIEQFKKAMKWIKRNFSTSN